MLDDAVAYLAQDSRPAAERLLIDALETASSLDAFSERGRVVPEWNQPNVPELFVQHFQPSMADMRRSLPFTGSGCCRTASRRERLRSSESGQDFTWRTGARLAVGARKPPAAADRAA